MACASGVFFPVPAFHCFALFSWLASLLSRYTGYPCVSAETVYFKGIDRHRQPQRAFSHCSYHTSPHHHCGQATHRGWPFLEFEQFLPAVLSLSLHRPFGTHCQTMSANSDALATFKKRLKTHLFTASSETFLPPSASAFLIMALCKFYSFIHSYQLTVYIRCSCYAHFVQHGHGQALPNSWNGHFVRVRVRTMVKVRIL